MEKKLLTGEELVRQKAILQRDFPSSGSREFSPTNTWLEKKQIQTCLDEKYSLLNFERIEKTANLSVAEWMPEINKAKVTKKVGKYWEVFGHAKDNSDWLYPEEALFLLEINALQIFHGQVPVSIEQGYLLLIGNGCTLNEYYVFSSLSKKGYKLIRHDEDAINLPCLDKTNETTQDCIEDKTTKENNENLDTSTENSDVFIIEDEIEIIEVDCDSIDSNTKLEKEKKSNDSILIESDEDDVVYLPSTSKSECRPWYKPLQNSLIPYQQEETVHTNFKEIDYFDLKNKTVHEILKNIDGNNKEIMSSPDDRFIPQQIKPSHSVYKVNLKEFFDNRNENENPNETMEIVERPQSNNRVRRYLQRPYNYQESSDTSYNTVTNPYPLQSISPVQNYNDSNFQRGFHHGRGRGNYFNFQIQPFRNNEIQQFHNNEMHPVNNNLLAQALEMRLMAVNMMNTAFRLLAGASGPRSHQPHMHMHHYPRPPQNYFQNNVRHQRTWTPRYRGTRKRPRYDRPPNYYNAKNFPTSSKVNIVQDFIVLDSDDDEKEPKPHIKTLNSKPIKKVVCIDITGDKPTHIRFPEEECEYYKPQDSQTNNNQCSSNIIENKEPKPDKNDMEIDVSDEISNSETRETDMSAEITEPVNWKQYKQLPSTQKESHIIDPLINLDEMETINGKLYESLQIFKPFTISPDKGKPYKVSFDMYAPNEQFKKSTRTLPKFRIIVQSIQDILPSKYDIDALKNIYQDEVPFLFAIVLEESINFYMYDCVTIPNLF